LLTLFELACRVYGYIPRLLKTATARLVGRVVFRLNSRVRRNTIANMSVVLNLPPHDARVRDVARRSVMEYAEYAASVPDYYRISPEDIAETTTYVDPDDILARALAQGSGAIFAAGHFGNWDIAGARMASMTPLWTVQETFGDSRMNEILRRIRESKNIKAVQMGDSLLPLFRGLMRGDAVGLMIDRPTPGEGVEVEFFGRRTMVPDGIGRLAVRFGLPVVVGGALRRRDGRHTLFALGSVDVDLSGTDEVRVQRVTQGVFHHFEKIIRTAPEQWYMFRKMWDS